MLLLKLIVVVGISSVSSFALAAGQSLCDVLNLPNCASVNKMSRRASAQSLPSAGTASQFNPANVSHDRGFGVETFYQPGNSANFGLVTGTGKMGAALVTSNTENAFFGNRVPEIEANFLKRNDDREQYDSKKYSLALGRAIFKGRNAGLDLGLILRYNEDVQRLNLGPGASLRLGPFSFGYSLYKDDFFLKGGETSLNPRTDRSYASEWGGDTYQESFSVQSMFAGLKIKSFFIDVGELRTKYKFYTQSDQDSVIRIYSASLIVQKFLLSLAHRREDTPTMKYVDGELEFEEEQNSMYGGVQYSLNKFIVLGAHYNYYLLDEVSGSLTVFF